MQKLAVARLTSQILRDVSAPGTGQARASELAKHADIPLENLAGLIDEVLAELTQLVLDSEFVITICGNLVKVERRAAAKGVFTFLPLTAPADSFGPSFRECEELADKAIALLPSHHQNDAAGRRRIVEVLAKRPYEEVEQVLEASLWISKKTPGLKFWQAAMRRLSDAGDKEAWPRRLSEAQDTLPAREEAVSFLATIWGSAKPEELAQAAWGSGVFAGRVFAEVEKRRADKAKATTARE